MGQITVITSGKGGTGKSTCTIGLASAFSSFKEKVLVFDLDEGLRCLDLMLGVSESLVFDLSDILSGEKTLDEAKLKVNDFIDLVAAPANICGFDRKKFSDLVFSASDIYDRIIIDCPAGIDTEFYKNIPSFADVCIVEPLNYIGSRSAATLQNLLTEYGIEHKYLILNKFNYSVLKHKMPLNIDDIIDKTGLMIKGIIPYDQDLDDLSQNGRLYNTSSAFSAFCRIAKRLDNKNVPLPELKKI